MVTELPVTRECGRTVVTVAAPAPGVAPTIERPASAQVYVLRMLQVLPSAEQHAPVRSGEGRQVLGEQTVLPAV
jgi:hypothetical protein